MNSYNSNWNTPYKRLIVSADEFPKIQSGREYTLDERYAIKLCFKTRKESATETYGMLSDWLLEYLAWIEHQFLEWHKRFKEGKGVCEGWWDVWEE